MEWWVTKGDRRPIGPVSTELLLQGIGAGMVPRDALVCEVGGTAWRQIRETLPFSIAIDERRGRHRFDPDSERTIADPPSTDDFLSRFDNVVEHTMVDRSPLRPSEPPPRPWLERFDDADEKTIVDKFPLRASDPPTEP